MTSPSPGPPDHVLPEHYRVWQREDGSWWQLGRGAVYKATDLRTDATVALRFFDAGPRTPDAMGALAEYAATLARPSSPLIAPLRDFFVSGAFNVAATEFIAGESLAERVQRDGPLGAGSVWTMARWLLDALGALHERGLAHGNLEASKILFPTDDDGSERPLILVEAGLYPSASVAADAVAGSAFTREDLRQLGATLWFALTGDLPEMSPDVPLPWQSLDAAGITPALGALPVLLARTLTGDSAQRPPTAPGLRQTLNVLESFRSAVPSWQPMPSRAPSPEPIAPTPIIPPPAAEESELWTRSTARLTTPNRRRRKPGQFLGSLLLLAIGGSLGFFGGIAYERHHQQEITRAAAASPAPLQDLTPTPSPDPGVPLPPSPPVSAVGVSARLDRVKSLQPDVRDILKYARELRRVATLPVADATAFPTETQVTRLLERFDWADPASPNFHRTPLLLVLGCSNEGSDAQGLAGSQRTADAMAQALAQRGITSPIYTCGLGSQSGVPELEPAGMASGQFIEVWVGFTLF